MPISIISSSLAPGHDRLHPEAIVDSGKKKSIFDYQDLMRACFDEYARVLKPGRWMTVVFSNSANAVWRAIQEALGTAGFVVADVRTLDKQQGSYRQVTSTAVKQDLVISAYKPTEALAERFALGQILAGKCLGFRDRASRPCSHFLQRRWRCGYSSWRPRRPGAAVAIGN